MSHFSAITGERMRKPDDSITVATFFDAVKTGRWKKAVKAVRAAEASGLSVKAQLPAIKPSGEFADLSAGSLQKHSGVLCADIDVKDNAEQFRTDPNRNAFRRLLRLDPHVVGFCRSAGDGLAVFVAVDATNVSGHDACFRTAATYFLEKFGVTLDSSCRDVSRNRFVSFDPRAWIRRVGEVEMFKQAPRPAPDVKEGCPIDYGTCPIDSKNEFLPSPPSGGLEDPGLRDRGLEHRPPEGPNRPSSSNAADTSRFSPKLYVQWVAHRHAVQGTRNNTIRDLVPVLLNIVGRDMTLTFLLKWYDDHAATFRDSRAQHETETRAMIDVALRSYATNVKIGLTDKERATYATLDTRRQDVFRIARSLSRVPGNGAVFRLTDFHLGQRLGCDKASAGRVLDYLVRDNILEIVERGEQWRPGCPPKATRYRWTLTSP